MVDCSYWLWEGALSKDFCDFLLQEINWDEAESGVVGNSDGTFGPDSVIRRTDVIWQHNMLPIGCIARSHMESANQQANWNYTLTEQESTQLGRYRGEDQGYYDWHKDTFAPVNGIQRKLTCVILLNDPSEFEGGVLQFKGMEDTTVLKKRGSIVVFPAFIEHRVTPVTQGVRYTAVTWAYGPAFK